MGNGEWGVVNSEIAHPGDRRDPPDGQTRVRTSAGLSGIYYILIPHPQSSFSTPHSLFPIPETRFPITAP